MEATLKELGDPNRQHDAEDLILICSSLPLLLRIEYT
jgi:hypothetical protein